MKKKGYAAFTGNSHSILCKRVTETSCSDINCLGGWRMGILRSEHTLNVRSETFNLI